MLYSYYADALTFTNQFNKETKEMLEGVLKATTSSSDMNFTDSCVIASAHMNLALVLQQMDVEPEKQKECVKVSFRSRSACSLIFRHTEWSVKWVRKNARRLNTLEQFLRRSNQPPHPVYVALGAEFFESLPGTTLRDDDRSSKRCRTCGLAEPQVKLFRCSGCQHIYYW